MEAPVIRKAAVTVHAPKIGSETSSESAHLILSNCDKSTNLRIVQLEVAQKEACRVLEGMCDDAAVTLGLINTTHSVDDILSGIMLLGNLYKRVGAAKTAAEERSEVQRHTHDEQMLNKITAIERLESVVLSLQSENVKAQDYVKELKLKHAQQLGLLQKDLKDCKDALEQIRIDREFQESKLQMQEKRLMGVPRLEEKFFRDARSIVRQQEMANTMKEIGWKKLEEDVKSLNYWKDRAHSLEETVAKMKSQMDGLNNQARSILSKYQNLLSEYNTLKRSTDMNKKRASSANPKRTSRGSIANIEKSIRADEQNNKPSLAGNVTKRRPQSATAIGQDSHSAKSQTIVGTKNIFGDSNIDRHAEEMIKLKSLLEKKEAIIQKLSRQLSFARSHPLMGIDEGPDPRFDVTPAMVAAQHTNEGGNTLHDNSISAVGAQNADGFGGFQKYRSSNSIERKFQGQSHSKNSKHRGSGHQVKFEGSESESNINQHFQQVATNMDMMRSGLSADADSQSSEFQRIEERLEQERLDMALRMQEEFNMRLKSTRASSAPHIAAIRKARSFARPVIDKIRTPG